ncbi:secretogranin-1 isoform X2 [Octodon degus]|nr:secretogranin-1 isoform X2 [Octodon degus]
MVTRCIIEVLSNALSKSSVPAVTPECRQVLKKSGEEVKDEGQSESENTKFEVRLLRDPGDATEAHRPSSGEKAQAPGEADAEDQPEAGKEKVEEGGKHSQEGPDESPESLYPSKDNGQVSEEAKVLHSEESKEEGREEEEEEDHPEREHGKEAGEGRPTEEAGDMQNAFLSKRNQVSVKQKEELVAKSGTHSAGLPEKTHSREKNRPESEEEMKNQEKHPQESRSQVQSEEESKESEEDETEVAKRHMRPRHHHGRTRPDSSFRGGNLPSEEKGQESEETNMAMTSLGEKRAHHFTHYRASEEEPEYGEEVRGYPDVQAPEDLEDGQYIGRGSEDHRAPRPHSEESWEEDNKRNHPSPELDNMAQGYSEESEENRDHELGKGHHYGRRGRKPGVYSTPDTREEKRFLGEEHHHVQEGQMDKARRHPQEEWQEQDGNYLNYGEEGAPPKWQQQEDLQDPRENGEEDRLPDRQYVSHHTTGKRKRLGVLFNPYFDPLQWKSSHFERRDNMDDGFLEDEEENALTLNKKNFFPEYNYDWWEKKPFSEDVSWGYEKRSFPRAPKLDLKRQYDRVAELDQLLHYRKKSAEFPNFYDSEEQMDALQEAENEQEGGDQRVLTEEEEKQLENLAAMDLELQKIAEKFSQRG